MDMVHSEEPMRQAFNDLLKDILKCHETLMVYRNARNKYSDKSRDSGTKAGVRGIESSRTVDDGVQPVASASLLQRRRTRGSTIVRYHQPTSLKGHTYSLLKGDRKQGRNYQGEGSKRRSTRMFGHIGPCLTHEYALKCDFK